MMGRRQYTTSLTSPVLALALAGCDKEFKLGDFVSDILAFDEPKDHAVVAGISTLIVLSASSGGGYEAPQYRFNSVPRIESDPPIAVDENMAGVFHTVEAEDIQGDTLTYSLTGRDADLFEISNAGALRFKTAPDYEASNAKHAFSFVIEVSDGELTAKQNVLLSLRNVNEFDPSITTTAPSSVAENVAANNSASVKGSAYVVYDVAASDGDNDALTYSLGGTDKDLFGINDDGEIWFRSSPDYEATPTKRSFSFTVTASDGTKSATQNISLALTNVNESAVFTVRGSVNASNKGVLTAEKLSDDPEGNGTFTYQWQRSSDGATGWADIGSATGTSYTPVDGTSNDGGKYLRVKITYTDSASNVHNIYDNITENGGHIQHRIFHGGDTSARTDNADIFTTDITGSVITRNEIEGGGGDDTLIHVHRTGATSGSLIGGSGNDTLIGGTSRDNLSGGAGDDILDGRGGIDTLQGDAGNDIFVLDTTADAVKDFATGDKIRIDTTEASVTNLTTLKSTASIDWTNTTNDARTGAGGVSGSNDANTNDTIIYNVGANGVLGGGDDTLLMVLEDYTTTLTFADFDIV